MSKIIIYFSDDRTIELKENEYLTPLFLDRVNGEQAVVIGEPIMIWDKLTNKQSFSLLNDLHACDFICINQDLKSGYNPRFINDIEIV